MPCRFLEIVISLGDCFILPQPVLVCVWCEIKGDEVETEHYSRTSWIRHNYVYLLDSLDIKYSNLVSYKLMTSSSSSSLSIVSSEQSINQSINQSIKQSIDQSVNQSLTNVPNGNITRIQGIEWTLATSSWDIYLLAYLFTYLLT